MTNQLNAALEYLSMGYSVIPIKQNKKPALMSWQVYQEKSPAQNAVRKWFQDTPTANIGIVTGKNSGLVVVDVDSDAGMKELEKYLPESLVTPIAQTPKGKHFYFAYTDGLVNRARVLQDCDVRTDGGYIIAPPGSNGNGGRYAWMPGLSMADVKPATMPEELRAALQMCSFNNALRSSSIGKGTAEGNGTPTAPDDTTRHNLFQQGSRDEALFHTANCLVKGGMEPDNILNVIKLIASGCTPPFPPKEAIAKVKSALQRHTVKARNIAEEVRDWVLNDTKGNFNTTTCHRELQLGTKQEMKAARQELQRLAKKGVIESTNRYGEYRKVESDCEEMDFLNAAVESTDLWLPFGLGDMVEIMPGNIIVVAGEPNAGKTGILLNVIRYNMGNSPIHYFNSEMGGSELKKRLNNFNGIPLSDWKFKAYERSSNFADAIKPGKGVINIVDFLEVHEDFYRVGGELAAIHNKLKGAIAVVALQKNKGTDTGLGGFRSLEKPRLYLSVAPGTVKIIKAKNWKDSKKNPNGLQVGFKIAAGCILSQKGDWHKGD